MPPSAAAESSKEVKLRKTYGRPILSCGGGTRIHNFPLPGDFPYSIILWGRGKHDPSRHLSPDRRTRMDRRKISSMPLNTLMCGEIGRISRVDNFIVELEVLLAKMMSSFDSCQVLLPPPICIWTIAWDTKISLTMRANLRDNGEIWGLSPTAYEMRPHFWAYAFWSSGKPRFSHCGCVLIVDAYSSTRRRRRL